MNRVALIRQLNQMLIGTSPLIVSISTFAGAHATLLAYSSLHFLSLHVVCRIMSTSFAQVVKNQHRQIRSFIRTSCVFPDAKGSVLRLDAKPMVATRGGFSDELSGLYNCWLDMTPLTSVFFTFLCGQRLFWEQCLCGQDFISSTKKEKPHFNTHVHSGSVKNKP